MFGNTLRGPLQAPAIRRLFSSTGWPSLLCSCFALTALCGTSRTLPGHRDPLCSFRGQTTQTSRCPRMLQQMQNRPDQPNQANSLFLRPQRHQIRPWLLRRAQPPATTWSAGVRRDSRRGCYWSGAVDLAPSRQTVSYPHYIRGGQLSAIIPRPCQ
ncbi:hypothetical protein CORC01_02174 [Colletotrichum orchidophilum]|uniref:Uncharacterized protein n=1 Tax=Colletotrichum orchidophilum TaxID=1209926 RepID=A0A1G4BLZ1_9PEZI|nr:uncharacterized protein CORC01_02174 [Colletotrichum orchidophilum]OHF02479.1 hypothetical protein CORC01_02174 [Colletotrichum orchidophilum]